VQALRKLIALGKLRRNLNMNPSGGFNALKQPEDEAVPSDLPFDIASSML
jgi:hypothetical protein